MFIQDLKNCEEFTSGDNCFLRELLHPDKADIDIRYSLAHAVVKSGQTTRLHRLTTSEVYYILEGDGKMHIDNEISNVHQGQAIYIPPGAKQRIQNTGTSNLLFLCIVDPAWRSKDEEIL